MKRKIALFYPWLNLYGGGEVFCEYTANLLSKKYLIDLYYFDNLKKIHKKLKFNKNINLIKLRSKNLIINYFCCKFMICAQSFLIFFFNKHIISEYKFVFSLSGEFFSKFKTFQYLHICIYSLNIFEYSNFGLKSSVKKIFRFIIVLICRMSLGINRKSFRNIVTFSNSSWSFLRAKNTYTLDYHKVLYPCFKIPKYINLSFSRFESKKNDFVILGRVSEDKRISEGINVFYAIKKIIPDAKLNIIGPINKSYKNKIKINNFFSKDIVFHGLVSLKKRDQIIKRCKYGLNFFYSEHFGRNVLELQKLGCIVFARNRGGVRELLFNKLQKYNNYSELIANLKKIYLNKKIRRKIFNKNKILKDKFTDRQFKNELFSYLN